MHKYEFDIKQDIVFQYILEQSTKESLELVKGLIETFLPFTIKDIELNPRIRNGYLEDEAKVIDAICELENGKIIRVGMMMDDGGEHAMRRIESYSAQILAKQVVLNGDFENLQPCFSIVFTNSIYMNMDSTLIHQFCFSDSNTKSISEDPKFNIVLVELPKASIDNSYSILEICNFLKYCNEDSKQELINDLIEKNPICAMLDNVMGNLGDAQKEELTTMIHIKNRWS